MSDIDEQATHLRERFNPTPAPTSDFEIQVTEGPDTGMRARIEGAEPGESLLGKSPACRMVLTDPEVSRRHLALEIVGSKLRIRDLDSTNGTLVNGLQVVEALLRGEEEIRVGSTLLKVTRKIPDDPPELPQRRSFGRLVGASTEMRRLYPLLERLAVSTIPVLIEGETGTGKELLAESLHDEGPRAGAPFVVLDCTAVPAGLMESELFGHERGAFTGAVQPRMGLVEMANGGTLFIDEIGELDLTLQPKLLRALERSEVRRVGGQRTTRVDIRVIAATNRNLEVEVQQSRFREDLFHRLAVGRVALPPLRRRRGDVAILARHLWQASGGDASALPDDLVLRWEQCAWPGNVRELRNAVLKRLALGDLAEEPKPSVPPAGSGWVSDILNSGLPLAAARQRAIQQFERLYVENILREHGGNVRSAAAAAGVARRYFQILKARTGTSSG